MTAKRPVDAARMVNAARTVNSRRIVNARRIVNTALLLMLVQMPATVFALSDPTRPSGFVAPAEGAQVVQQNLRLESVLIGAARRVAVINGKTCRVGERIEGATLVAINADNAILVRNGKRIALPLLKVKVRSDAN